MCGKSITADKKKKTVGDGVERARLIDTAFQNVTVKVWIPSYHVAIRLGLQPLSSLMVVLFLCSNRV